jgi:hypothetical protein
VAVAFEGRLAEIGVDHVIERECVDKLRERGFVIVVRLQRCAVVTRLVTR